MLEKRQHQMFNPGGELMLTEILKTEKTERNHQRNGKALFLDQKDGFQADNQRFEQKKVSTMQPLMGLQTMNLKVKRSQMFPGGNYRSTHLAGKQENIVLLHSSRTRRQGEKSPKCSMKTTSKVQFCIGNYQPIKPGAGRLFLLRIDDKQPRSFRLYIIFLFLLF